MLTTGTYLSRLVAAVTCALLSRSVPRAGAHTKEKTLKDLKQKLYQLVSNLVLERPAKEKTLGQLRGELEVAGREAQQRLATAVDSLENRETLRHIVGIERWGQRRLRAALGEPLVMDESDAYFPAGDVGWVELRRMFRETRNETVKTVDRLDEAEVGRDLIIPHKQFGYLTVHGWVYYLKSHADGDVRKIA